MKTKLAGAYIPEKTYESLKRLARKEHRTLADQCRHLFDRALSGDLSVPAAKAAKPQPAKGGSR